MKQKELLQVSEEEFVDNLNNALWKIYPKDGIVESGLRALQQLLESLSLQTGVVRQFTTIGIRYFKRISCSLSFAIWSFCILCSNRNCFSR